MPLLHDIDPPDEITGIMSLITTLKNQLAALTAWQERARAVLEIFIGFHQTAIKLPTKYDDAVDKLLTDAKAMLKGLGKEEE